MSEINAKCREIDGMKSQLQELGGLVGEKETLKSELRKTKEDLGRLAGEKDALAQELQETREQLGRLALPSSPAVPVCFFLPHQPPQLFPRLLQFPCKFSFLPRQPP